MANCATVTAGIDQLSLTRRADGIFPPIIVSVWMTARAQGVDHQGAPRRARRAVREAEAGGEGGDYALNRTQDRARLRTHSRRRLGHVLAHGRNSRADASSAVATTFVPRSNGLPPSPTGTRPRGCRNCACEPLRRTDAELRILEEEIHREEVVARALAAAIAAPTLRLDSTGIVVLSGRTDDRADR